MSIFHIRLRVLPFIVFIDIVFIAGLLPSIIVLNQAYQGSKSLWTDPEKVNYASGYGLPSSGEYSSSPSDKVFQIMWWIAILDIILLFVSSLLAWFIHREGPKKKSFVRKGVTNEV